jgi:hypothetical protein
MSQCLGECLREYFLWREKIVSTVGNAEPPVHASSGEPIHVVLARTESHLATTLDARFRGLVDELRLLQRMIDGQAASYFLHTPEVPAERQAMAVASASRRYRNWRRTVERGVQSRRESGALRRSPKVDHPGSAGVAQGRNAGESVDLKRDQERAMASCRYS